MCRSAWLSLGLCLLVAMPAGAHAFYFELVSPSGVGARTDGGHGVIQWADGPDPGQLAAVSIWVAIGGIAPWAGADAGDRVLVNATPIPLSDPLNVLAWDARGSEPGCYQPLAVVHDQIEGDLLFAAQGMLTVVGDGGNVPPSVWITNSPYQQPAADGTFEVHVSVDEPEEPVTVFLEAVSTATRQPQAVAPAQGLDAGGGALSQVLQTRALEPGFYALRATASSTDGRRCVAWWSGTLYARPEEPDAGTADAGEADGKVPSQPANSGCGCRATPGLMALALFLPALRRSRRAAPEPSGPEKWRPKQDGARPRRARPPAGGRPACRR